MCVCVWKVSPPIFRTKHNITITLSSLVICNIGSWFGDKKVPRYCNRCTLVRESGALAF